MLFPEMQSDYLQCKSVLMLKNSFLSVAIVFCFISSNAQEYVQKTFYHQFDDAGLITSSADSLKAFIRQLVKMDVTAVSVYSYTDKSGSNEYNKHLSEQRSNALLRRLKEELPASVKFNVAYFGEDSAVVLNDDPNQQERRSVIRAYLKNSPEGTTIPTITIEPYKEDVEVQRYQINLDDTVTIVARGGTYFRFVPGTFKNKRNKVINGKATVLIKEYYTPGDILLAGLSTESPEGLLQTGGMFKLLVIQDNDTMDAQVLKPVTLRMPDVSNQQQQMNVFTTNHSDTDMWNDTKKKFSYITGKWDWPLEEFKLRDFYVDRQIPFQQWAVGRKMSEEYQPGRNIEFNPQKLYKGEKVRPYSKFVTYTITKTDTSTLTINLHEKFKRRGFKRFGTRTFDTTFKVRYTSAYYETEISNLSFINCDRFLKEPNVTDFYVSTPNFEGAMVLVYFKNLKAFMRADWKKNKFNIKGVPADEEVELIAVGKKGDDFYYGHKEFTITKKATAKLDIHQVSYAEMKKMFLALGYKK